MSELIQKLGIDWKLLAAQAVNFLLLIWLLKKFLYGPILDLLAKRRKAIEDAAENTERIKKELDAIEGRKTAEMDKARKEADAILQETRRLAKEREIQLTKETEQKIERLVDDAKKRILEEKDKMMDGLSKEIREMVFAAAEKVIGERLPASANDKFVDEAIEAARKHRP
jgi:F-type H+-transporting ATPase subunit b